jgi:hypothetical protein
LDTARELAVEQDGEEGDEREQEALEEVQLLIHGAVD